MRFTWKDQVVVSFGLGSGREADTHGTPVAEDKRDALGTRSGYGFYDEETHVDLGARGGVKRRGHVRDGEALCGRDGLHACRQLHEASHLRIDGKNDLFLARNDDGPCPGRRSGKHAAAREHCD